MDRIYSQYSNKPKAVQWYKITETMTDDLKSGIDQIRYTYDIDAANGKQLDTLGAIVNISRTIIVDLIFNRTICGPVRSQCGPISSQFNPISVKSDTDLSDDYYREVIRAKVAINMSEATIEDIMYAISLLVPNADSVELIDNEDMTFEVTVRGTFTSIQVDILSNNELIPKPQGVDITSITFAPGIPRFGDSSVHFGDLSRRFNRRDI